jgi:hypothetical protein
MAAARRLKVFRTPIGFHDAYVAAPSRAAALRAWGTDRDLFARGAAEEVTDPALTAEPLARPGDVIRRLRESAAEQIAALPDPPVKPQSARPAEPPPEREPEPDRAALAEAERTLAAAERRIARLMSEFDDRAEALARERRAAERTARDERRRLERARDRVATAYAAAMTRWREGSR